MSFWETALLIGVIAAASVSWPNRRAWLWLLAAVADYVITTAFFSVAPYWLPPPVATCFVDGVLVLLLAIYGLHRWEMWFRRCFQASMLVSIADLLALGHVSPADLAYTYALFLEVCNWSALLVIGVNGLLDMADARLDMGRPWHRAFFRARVYLDAPRPRKTLLARLAR